MAGQIIWTRQAVDDLLALADYIARDSERYAEAVVSKIYHSVDSLGQFPRVGRIVPEVNCETVRELFVYQFRVIYESINDNIYILTIIHGKQNFDGQIK